METKAGSFKGEDVEELVVKLGIIAKMSSPAGESRLKILWIWST